MDSTLSVVELLTCKNKDGRQIGFIYFYLHGFLCKKILKKFQYRTIDLIRRQLCETL